MNRYKLRDEVSLDMLNKFGFSYEPLLNKYHKEDVPFFKNWIFSTVITVEKDTREIQLLVNPPYWELDTLDTMKNKTFKKLKKANLVEVIHE